MNKGRIAVFALLWVWTHFPVMAQNLVPNGSFEDYRTCPQFLGDFDRLSDWVQPAPPNLNSADFYHACAPQPVNVPETHWGHQYARTGNGMAGIIAWEGDLSGSLDVREYIQVRLSTPLVAGQKYCIQLYVSPGVGRFSNLQYVGIDEIGIHLSKDRHYRQTGYTLHLPYTLRSPAGTFLDDRMNWIKVGGVYQARGGEAWLTLGCFDQGTGPPSVKPIYPSQLDPQKTMIAYLFIDDVSVVPIDPSDTLLIKQTIGVCARDTANRTLRCTGNEGDHHWSSGQNGREIKVGKPGRYRCVSRSYCQVVIDEFDLMYDPGLQLDLGPDTGSCENLPVTLLAPGGFNAFQWSTGDTGSQTSVSHSQRIFLEAENECGRQKDSVYVYIETRPSPPITSDTFLCQGVKHPVFNVVGDSLRWYSHSNSLVGTEYMPYIHTEVPGWDSVFVTQRSAYCESEKAAIYVKIFYQPKEEIPDEWIMCGKEPEMIGTPAQPETKYSWNTGSRESTVFPTREGTYTRITRNVCGEYADHTRVKFSDCIECLIMPNAFYVQGGGRGSSFQPEVICPVKDYELRIFNRWGNLVFLSRNLDKGWNGQFDELPAPGGAYVYLVNYRSAVTGDPIQLSGTVYLIR